MADSKAKKLSLGKDLKKLAAYTGKGLIKKINNATNHDGFRKVLAIGGIAATTYFISPLVIMGVGGLTAAKWAADKLSNDSNKNSKGVFNEFLEVAGYGANVIGKASEIILSPRLENLSQSIDNWEHGIKPEKNSPEPKPGPEPEPEL